MKVILVLLCLYSPSLLWAEETIELHQTACQFIEAEGGDKHYQASSRTSGSTIGFYIVAEVKHSC
ncbi:MAG: hypothetical protein Q9M44_04765 [Ghiorsea sp.]|nr:hypothetical protein [Ghiorsea sp.]